MNRLMEDSSLRDSCMFDGEEKAYLTLPHLVSSAGGAILSLVSVGKSQVMVPRG